MLPDLKNLKNPCVGSNRRTQQWTGFCEMQMDIYSYIRSEGEVASWLVA